MTDDLTKQLEQIKSELPTPRKNLNLDEKVALIKNIGGPRTTRSILKAKETLPIARIPFLFNSLDTQFVMDVLENDMDEALRVFDKK